VLARTHWMLIAAVSCGGFLASSPTVAAAGDSTYSGQQLEIREVTLTESGKVQITFNTMPETLYYCPGANGEASQRGTVLTFVRSFAKAKPKVDYPAKRKGDPAKTWDQLILVDAKDKPIFVKSGKDLVRMFPVDDSAAVGAIHAERIATLEASLIRVQELYSQGNVSRGVVSDAMIELGEARVEAAANQDDRTAALKDLLSVWKQYEDTVEQHVQAGVKSHEDLLRVRALRLETELKLAAPGDAAEAAGALIVIEARFIAASGDDTDLLTAPKVTARTGQQASVKAVTDRHCPNDEIVEEGVILNVTPTLENGVVTLKGSVLIVDDGVAPEDKDIEKDVRWIGFRQWKTTFLVVARDPKIQYRLGPIETNGKKYEIWLSACEVAE